MKDYEIRGIEYITKKIIEMKTPDIDIIYSIHLVMDSIDFKIKTVNGNDEIINSIEFNLEDSDFLKQVEEIEAMFKKDNSVEKR